MGVRHRLVPFTSAHRESSLSSEDLIPVPSLAEHVREMWILDLWCLGGEDLLSIIVQRGSFVI